MTPERRRAGRVIRKERRLRRRARPGRLYYAPMGTSADAWPVGWVELGYSAEGMRAPALSADEDEDVASWLSGPFPPSSSVSSTATR